MHKARWQTRTKKKPIAIDKLSVWLRWPKNNNCNSIKENHFGISLITKVKLWSFSLYNLVDILLILSYWLLMSSRKRPARTRVISYTKSSFVNKLKQKVYVLRTICMQTKSICKIFLNIYIYIMFIKSMQLYCG